MRIGITPSRAGDQRSAIMPLPALANWKCGAIWMASEFKQHNDRKTVGIFRRACRVWPIQFEPHVEFKRRVPYALGLIRTGDTTIYGNMILESA